ncbi:MAG: glycosyltransferase [Actinomycetota bacterium]|nr:MAG: glycosyltransferase [Actinomycetota bacterium]
MFVFLLQLRQTITQDDMLYLFSVFCLLVWFLWILKVVLSRRYRPWTEPHDTTTSVVIPVVDEPLDLFREVLERVVAQRPDEVIVVINGPRNQALEAVCADVPGVVHLWTPIPGKRNAVKLGTEASTGDITVLVDSDTVWTDGTLAELVKPFADPRVGGVTTKQRILDYRRSLITRWADWLENSRALYSMPAQSVLGQVGCLPGRTIAFRRSILVEAMPAFMHEKFLGVFLEVSDDRTLTNLALKQGYRTVYQSTSLVYTDAPLQWRKLYKQQLRWARGSQYNTMRMTPWMLGHAPVLAVFFILDIVLPFLLLGAVIGAVWRVVSHTGINYYSPLLDTYGMSAGLAWVAFFTVVSSMLSMGIRQLRHLHERPTDLLWMPVFVVMSTCMLFPIRIWGFFRLAKAGSWGTRANAYSADQSESDPLAELTHTVGSAPTDIVDRPRGGVAVAPATTVLAAGAAVPQADSRRRRVNWQASVPVLIGLTVIALEVLYRG